MRTTLKTFVIICALACVAQSQARKAPNRRPAGAHAEAVTPYGLPAGAHVVEVRPLELGGAKKRALVLWMVRPKRYPRGAGEGYTCPEETRGSFYRGPARVSLVEVGTARVINTLRVVQEYSHGEDEFDVPYRIRAGGHYHVERTPPGREGRPTVMWLRDLNGDGRALEFALFDALACMGLETTLIGYSERQDRVIQYPVSLETEYAGQKTRESLNWVDYLFSREPSGAGRWKFEIDYRGRGGTLDSYDVHYNERAERFEGTVTRAGEQ